MARLKRLPLHPVDAQSLSSEHYTKSRNTLNHMASYLLVLDDAMKSLADGTPLKIHESDMPLFVAVSVPWVACIGLWLFS